MRVLVFGDSITQGFWAIEHGWVDLIRKHYAEHQIGKNSYHGIFNLGVDADNSANILKRIKSEVEARVRPHHTVKPLVLVQIGLNDAGSGDGEVKVGIELEEYKQNLKDIVASINSLVQDIILVGYNACDESKTNPVTWGSYVYKNDHIKIYEDSMRDIAESEGAKFVPVFEKFKEKIDAGEDLLTDGLHPNDAGHELIYNIVLPRIQELLV